MNPGGRPSHLSTCIAFLSGGQQGFRRRLRTISAHGLIVTALAACSTDPLKGDYAGYSAEALTAATVKGQRTTVDELLTELGFPATAINNCMAPASNDLNCKALRNRVTATLVMNSEELCLRHRRSIYGKEAGFNIAAGSFTNLFSGWAAVASGERGKSILSALALFSNSERSLVNELVYKSVVVPAVDKKILQIRDAKAQAIRERFGDPIDAYPLGTAISDVLEFHRACSFMNGLEKAIEEGVQETARQKAERLKRDLLLLQAQLSIHPSKDEKDPVYAGLLSRYNSMSEEIRTLEKQ